MDTGEEFSTVYELVDNLLGNDVRCRNCDKWLTFKVMQHFTKIYIPFEDFQKIPAFETVKRTRAKIQNYEQRFMPTDPDVIRRRQKRSKEVRNWMGYK